MLVGILARSCRVVSRRVEMCDVSLVVVWSIYCWFRYWGRSANIKLCSLLSYINKIKNNKQLV